MKGSPKKFLNEKFHNIRQVGKPRTRWEDVVRRDTSQILGIRGWKRRAKDIEEWRRLLREARAQTRLWRHAWIGMEARGIKKPTFVYIIEVHYVYIYINHPHFRFYSTEKYDEEMPKIWSVFLKSSQGVQIFIQMSFNLKATKIKILSNLGICEDNWSNFLLSVPVVKAL